VTGTRVPPVRRPERRAWVEQLMGMPVSIHLRGDGARSAAADARVQAVFDELRAVDVLFSPYRADSQVSAIDRGELAVADAHPLVREVVDLCRAAAALTGGVFDAWRPVAGAPPGTTRFDPTGLVKGWAVQRAADHLGAGLECDVAVNAGGDVAAHRGTVGAPAVAAAEQWRVGIEDPADPTRVLAVLPLASGGVATSGTAHRGRHLTDPRTGTAVAALASVTVTGPSLLWADVLATAAFVAGAGALDLVAGVSGYQALVLGPGGEVTQSEGLVRLR
jgi:thiamine biosynthesis lipoprotein